MSSYLRHRTVQYEAHSWFTHSLDSRVVGSPVRSLRVTGLEQWHIRIGSNKLYVVSAINASIESSVFVVE